jgi:PadR family transcriptional regulator
VAELSLIQGTADMLVLKALAKGPLHGYAISRWVHERTNGALGFDDAALYQALHRLERKRLVDAEWGTSENNRRARFYSLTATGRKHLRIEADVWRRYATAVFQVLDS